MNVSKSFETSTPGKGNSGARSGPSLFSIIVTACVVGVGCGLFFGEHAAGLRIVGDIYVGLLQMTVLPYIVFSLIGSIGRLSLTEGTRLAICGVLVLALLWVIGCLTVGLTALAFPRIDTGAFFSTSLVTEPESPDFLSLYIPSNPFHSLAETNLAINNERPAHQAKLLYSRQPRST